MTGGGMHPPTVNSDLLRRKSFYSLKQNMNSTQKYLLTTTLSLFVYLRKLTLILAEPPATASPTLGFGQTKFKNHWPIHKFGPFQFILQMSQILRIFSE